MHNSGPDLAKGLGLAWPSGQFSPADPTSLRGAGVVTTRRTCAGRRGGAPADNTVETGQRPGLVGGNQDWSGMASGKTRRAVTHRMRLAKRGGSTGVTAASQLRRLLQWSSTVEARPCSTGEGRRGWGARDKDEDGRGAALTWEAEVVAAFGSKTC
jgi:hypothetical protein